mmetsp:Transcript_31801/g.68693  ORF Transcript_31801/g.68693 Transcript_31801/m.68693 type:complete len:154 (-) Transcript_31801:127-588(-)
MRQWRLVSESHDDDRVAEDETRTAELGRVYPALDPATVTLWDPVPAMFTADADDTTTTSLESAEVSEPRDPTVTPTPVWSFKLPTRQAMALSDTHRVPNVLVPPILTPVLDTASPTLDPTMVTLAAPDPAPLARTRLLTATPSALIPNVALPR